MRMIAKSLVTTFTTSLMLVTASPLPARAADLTPIRPSTPSPSIPMAPASPASSALDLPAGDTTLVAKDFPLTLDPSSLRVEGEAGAKLTIGSIDARPPRAAPPVNLPELDKRIEALKDERANLQGAIAAATARRKFAERFAEASPAGMGEKGEARPIAEWRAAFAAVAEEVASANTAIRDAERKQRDIDREIARLESDRAQKPPSKLEVRIDLAARCGDQGDAAGDLCGAQRALGAALRRAPRYRGKRPQARARTGAPRRHHAIDRRGLVERRRSASPPCGLARGGSAPELVR